MENVNDNTKIDLLNELYNAWGSAFKSDKYDEEHEYLAEVDQDLKYLNRDDKQSNPYHTKVVPLPFWGNIYDPDYIVLSNNPSKEPIVDELESLFFYGDLKNTLTNDSGQTKINWLNDNYDLRTFVKKKPEFLEGYGLSWGILQKVGINTLFGDEFKHKCTTTYDWWNGVFDDVEYFYDSKENSESNDKNKKKIDKNEIFKKVGFFNLCGYHSRSYSEIPQKYKNISTIRATIEYVQHLIKTNNELKIILIWGQEWKEYIYQCRNNDDEFNNLDLNAYIQKLEDKKRLIIVNKYCNQNKSLTKYKNKCNKTELNRYNETELDRYNNFFNGMKNVFESEQ